MKRSVRRRTSRMRRACRARAESTDPASPCRCPGAPAIMARSRLARGRTTVYLPAVGIPTDSGGTRHRVFDAREP